MPEQIMLDRIYNAIINELKPRLSTKGYKIHINRLHSENNDDKYMIWWNETLQQSILFGCFNDQEGYTDLELCKSFKKGNPSLNGFDWYILHNEPIATSEIPKLTKEDADDTVNSFLAEFDSQIDNPEELYRLNEIDTNENKYNKRQQRINKIFVIGFIVVIFAPIIYISISSRKTNNSSNNEQRMQIAPSQKLLDSLSATQASSKTEDSTTR